MATPSVLTTGDLARRFGVPIWTLRRLFDAGVLPSPDRVGLYRTVSADRLPAIEDALRRAGYLKTEEAAPCP